MVDYLLIASFLILTISIIIVIIYLAITEKIRLLTFLVIPILILNVVLMGTTITSFRGYAVDNYLPEKFLIHHFIAIPKEKIIYLLIENKDNKVVRLHKVPYSEKLHRELEKAKESTKGKGKEHLRIEGKKKPHKTDIQLQIENPTEEIKK